MVVSGEESATVLPRLYIAGARAITGIRASPGPVTITGELVLLTSAKPEEPCRSSDSRPRAGRSVPRNAPPLMTRKPGLWRDLLPEPIPARAWHRPKVF